MKKHFVKMVTCFSLGVILTSLAPAGTALAAEYSTPELSAFSGPEISLRTGGYIAKNHRTTNYRVTSGWYYSHTVNFAVSQWGVTVSRRYNVFRRNVSYTAQYDLYDKYSNRYIRTVSTKHNSVEEQHRLVY
ncbi:hypothetical protein [Enterococcus sp. CWB-B31]|uniref:hypothetical protein n=1 Tax=Enterococcus sp. CWB-B31 TaxID=2885159 RepID=UPI001E526408|nr:hypothetical protein [Enterococcus sp. CWB-B31]MCB5956035.1 hypothetical protein [Enterococcus sp. CWB-B31]